MDNCDWDPRETDFRDSEFNSYNRGPGARLDRDLQPWSKSVEKRKGPYKLHVSNIPLNITEGGFKNIFSKFGEVFNVKKSTPEPGYKFNYGFVTYATHSEAEKAIRELNQQKPLYLKVQFARSESERERLRKKKEEERLFTDAVASGEFNKHESQVKSSTGVGRGRFLESIEVKKDTEMKYGSKVLPANIQNEDDCYSSYEAHRFDETNRLLMNVIHYSKNSSMGHRRVSMGRGHLHERSPQVNARHSLTTVSHKDFCNIAHNSESNISFGESHSFGTAVHLQAQRAGPCLYCSKITSSVCRRCRDFYCSQACQEHDWHNHRPQCFPIPGVMDTSENDHNRYSGSPFDIVSQVSPCFIDNVEIPCDLKNVKSNFECKNEPSNKNIQGDKLKNVRNPDFHENYTTKTGLNNAKSDVTFPHNSNPNKNKGECRQTEQLEGNTYNRGKQVNANTKFDKQSLSNNQSKGFSDTRTRHNSGEPSDILKNTVSANSKTNIEEIVTSLKLSEDLHVEEKQKNSVSRSDLSPTNSAVEDTMSLGSVPQISSMENTTSGNDECQIKYETLDKNDFTDVNIAYSVGNEVYWVQKKSLLQDLYEVLHLLQDCDKKPSYTPQVGGICGALFEGVWYRAEILSVTPKLRVRYIDFGNEEDCTHDQLRVLPLNTLSLPAQAIKVRLADGTPGTYSLLKEDSSLVVKPQMMSEEGYVVVKVKGADYESAEVKLLKQPEKASESENADLTLGSPWRTANSNEGSMETKKFRPTDEALSGLSVGMIGFMQIRAILNAEAFTASIVHEKIEEAFLAVIALNDCCKKYDDKLLVKAQVGDVVAAQVDSEWYRAHVMQEYETMLGVALCDFGYCAKVSKVMTLPDGYCTLPELSVRCDISEFVESKANLWDNYFKKNEKIKFCVEEISEDVRVSILHSTEEKLCEARLRRWLPLTEEVGFRCVSLTSSMPVIVNVVMNHNILYVRPADKISIQQFNRLIQDVGLHCLTAIDINYMPVKGELVACRYNKDSNYYRAVIESFDKEEILISFIDFGNREIVSMKDIKGLSEDLKKVPAFAVKVTLKTIVEKPLTSKALAYLQELILNDEILKLEFTKSLKEVELFESDGTNLNSKINSYIDSSWKDNCNRDEKLDEIVYNLNDAVCVELPVGTTIDFYIGHYNEPNDIIGTYPGSDTFTYVTSELQKEINNYCNETKDTFLPRVDELCLAKYEEEWYRAACLDVKANQAKLLFVDFGNIEVVSFKDIRRIVTDFSSSPILAVRCVLEQPPESLDDINKLKAKLLVGTVHKIKVLKADEGIYKIELL